MSMWSYPIGAIVNNGEPLTVRTVRPALPFTIGEVSQGPIIFERWSLADIAALGIKLFIENPVPQDYIPGAPVDIETDTQITRTYPDMHLDQSAIITRQKQAIFAELSKLDGERVRATSAVTLAQANGVDPDPADVAKLNEYEARAVVLRQELAALDVANTPMP
jgi:hypothetical protein